MNEIGKNFPLTRAQRKEKLSAILLEDEPIATMKFPERGRLYVYKIPLQFLSYNPHNARFLMRARTFEKQLGRELFDEIPEDISLIEDFLWDQKREENELTINSLIKDGQLLPGLVTREGIILSGNRRFRLLNEINRHRDQYSSPQVTLDELDYFEAAIIEETLDMRAIVRLEAFYQYGTEDKVEYDPIQKYIAAYEQKKLGYSEQEIANHFMAITKGKETEVKKWLEVFSIMEEYLDYIGEEKIYTALEFREEAFRRLRSDLQYFNSTGVSDVDWAYSDYNLQDLKFRFFDYIRINVPTHDVRIFRNIFSNQQRWKKFNSEVVEVIENNDVDPFDEYLPRHKDLPEEQVSIIRNNDFKDKVEKTLNQIYGAENALSHALKVKNTPTQIMKEIQQRLAKIEEELKTHTAVETFKSNEFLEAVDYIQKWTWRIKQFIRKLPR